MKTKLKTIMMIAAATVVISLAAQAQNTDPSKREKENTPAVDVNNSRTFVDKNNNGKCDNYEARQTTGSRSNFVDKDGDGICDNKQNSGAKCSSSSPNGRFCSQKGNGNGNCCGSRKAYRHRSGGNMQCRGNVK